MRDIQRIRWSPAPRTGRDHDGGNAAASAPVLPCYALEQLQIRYIRRLQSGQQRAIGTTVCWTVSKDMDGVDHVGREPRVRAYRLGVTTRSGREIRVERVGGRTRRRTHVIATPMTAAIDEAEEEWGESQPHAIAILQEIPKGAG